MFRLVRPLLAAPLLLTLFACAPAPLAPAATPTAVPATQIPAPAIARAPLNVAADFDAARAYRYNQTIAVTIGSRPAGSDIGVKAGDYIAQQFSDAGFTVEKQAFPFQAWEDLGTQVQLTAPEALAINATPIQYSPAGAAEAELAAVAGNGTENDFASAKIRGMLNFDMLGGGSGPLLLGGDGNLGQLGRDVAGQLGITARNFRLGGGASSDHESLQRIGVDTIFFSRDYSLLHTPQDTVDEVKQDYLNEAGRVAVRLLAQVDAE